MRRGFTLVEAVAALGVLMVLVSLAAPSLGKSLHAGRTTRDAVQLRQNITVLAAYCNDYRDAFPVAHSNAFNSARLFYEPLVRGGYFSSATEIDPAGARQFGGMTFSYSLCLTYPPRFMLPGQTVPETRAAASQVFAHNVSFPSSKGAMHKRWSGEQFVASDRSRGRHFCCVSPWKAPVGMCDNSVITTDYLELEQGKPAIVVDGIGETVFSTWGGVLGRDR